MCTQRVSSSASGEHDFSVSRIVGSVGVALPMSMWHRPPPQHAASPGVGALVPVDRPRVSGGLQAPDQDFAAADSHASKHEFVLSLLPHSLGNPHVATHAALPSLLVIGQLCLHSVRSLRTGCRSASRVRRCCKKFHPLAQQQIAAPSRDTCIQRSPLRRTPRKPRIQAMDHRSRSDILAVCCIARVTQGHACLACIALARMG